MRVLAHIHTHNEAAFIEQALEGLRRQTRPPEAIVIVDNLSTDGTLARIFPENVTVIRNSTDLGPTGSVAVGLSHALKEGFDWTWVFDADSVPEPDALENLLAFFGRLAAPEREHVCFLACRLAVGSNKADHRPMVLTGAGIERLSLDADTGDCRCDCFIWSGSLFRMSAVARIGLPAADYVMDLSELEYGYRARQLDYSSYVVSSSVLHQDVGREAGAMARRYRFGPIGVTFYDTSPQRTYYSTRNMIHFWLYQHKPRRLGGLIRWLAWRVVGLVLNVVLRPRENRGQILACSRGVWHGVTANMTARY
jgi:rhamnopyranosyl-N-acetylglucosaminyl-diphospho-decaprenol beta-1,3/1,4-galactofuranosyltransferase